MTPELEAVTALKRSSRAIGEIAQERRRQDTLWGPVQHHEPLKWFGILSEEVGEVIKAILDHEPAAALRAEITQVAAVAMAWLEDDDKQRGLS